MQTNTKELPTILVVDDEREVVDLLAKVLRQLGYDVLEVHSPSDAVSVCVAASRPIDLVLSDVDMPGLNGIQLAQNLRGIQPHIKFVFMSGNPHNCEHLIADGYVCLAKPFSFTELRDTVQQKLQETR